MFWMRTKHWTHASVVVTLVDVASHHDKGTKNMTQISNFLGFAPLAAAVTEYRASRRALRAARAEQQELTTLLSGYYSTAADRAEMDAILGRYEETATHRAWDAIGARA
jgi:hypothetical protein